MDFSPSHDGRLLACSMQAGGGEIGVLRVMDIAGGRQLIEPIDRIRCAGVSWLLPSVSELPGRGVALVWIGLGVERNVQLAQADLRAVTEGQVTWRNWVTVADEVQGQMGEPGFQPR
jgi:hypothetical protein